MGSPTAFIQQVSAADASPCCESRVAADKASIDRRSSGSDMFNSGKLALDCCVDEIPMRHLRPPESRLVSLFWRNVAW